MLGVEGIAKGALADAGRPGQLADPDPFGGVPAEKLRGATDKLAAFPS